MGGEGRLLSEAFISRVFGMESAESSGVTVVSAGVGGREEGNNVQSSVSEVSGRGRRGGRRNRDGGGFARRGGGGGGRRGGSGGGVSARRTSGLGRVRGGEAEEEDLMRGGRDITEGRWDVLRECSGETERRSGGRRGGEVMRKSRGGGGNATGASSSSVSSSTVVLNADRTVDEDGRTETTSGTTRSGVSSTSYRKKSGRAAKFGELVPSQVSTGRGGGVKVGSKGRGSGGLGGKTGLVEEHKKTVNVRNQNDQHTVLAADLIERLTTQNYECMVCVENIMRYHHIW